MSAVSVSAAGDKEVPKVESLECLVKKIQDCAESKCLGKIYLTPDVVREMNSIKSKYGCSLAHIIRNCALNPKSECPRVGDSDCYKVFHAFLDIVIKTYHKIPSDDFMHPPPTFGDIENLPFGNLDPKGDQVVSTRVRVGRSIDGFAFSTIISKEDRLILEERLSAVLKSLTGEFEGTYHSLVGMDEEIKQKLIHDHFLFGDSNKIFHDAGGYRDWPVGRGIFYNKDKTFLCWIGEEDHLRVISMQDGGDLAVVYARLIRGLNAIESRVQFCHSEKYGYLNCCPSNLGTSMRASVHARVPKLSADKTKLDAICKQHGLEARGAYGEHTESIGGVFDLSNERRLGLTELEAATEMADGVKKILELEASL
nr:unnamed protein product [Spirometra erinaceieuropaei]